MHPCDICPSVIVQKTPHLLFATDVFNRTRKYPRVQWSNRLHREIHQSLKSVSHACWKKNLPFLRPLLHGLVSKLVAIAWGEMVQHEFDYLVVRQSRHVIGKYPNNSCIYICFSMLPKQKRHHAGSSYGARKPADATVTLWSTNRTGSVRRGRYLRPAQSNHTVDY